MLRPLESCGGSRSRRPRSSRHEWGSSIVRSRRQQRQFGLVREKRLSFSLPKKLGAVNHSQNQEDIGENPYADARDAHDERREIERRSNSQGRGKGGKAPTPVTTIQDLQLIVDVRQEERDLAPV